jgi:hypothetical protein
MGLFGGNSSIIETEIMTIRNVLDDSQIMSRYIFPLNPNARKPPRLPARE